MLLVIALLALTLISVGTRLGAQEGTITEGETPGYSSAADSPPAPAIATMGAVPLDEAFVLPTATLMPTATVDIPVVLQPQGAIGRDIAYSTSSVVKVKDANGNPILASIPTGTFYPAWSLNGLQIAYVNTTSNSVCEHDTLLPSPNEQCHGSSAITVVPRVDNRYWDPVWSPNLSKLAFVLSSAAGRVDIFISGRDGSNLTNLTSSLGTTVNLSPAWSLDGNLLAFAGVVDASTNAYNIYVYNVGANTLATVTTDGNQNRLPFWERGANNKLGFASGSGICSSGSAICIVDNYLSPAPRAFTPLTDSSIEWGAVWSPDGVGVRYAYMSYQTGNWEIYTSGGTNITNDPANQNQYPKWRPTMEEALRLFNVYVAVDGGDTALRQHVIREVLMGVEDTAKALNSQFVNIQGSYLGAFLLVMHEMLSPARPISFAIFNRTTAQSNLVCLNSYGGIPPNTTLPQVSHQSYIECDIDLLYDFTRYTVVHELGHTFTQRTGFQGTAPNSYFNLILTPRAEPIGSIRDNNEQVVMGFGQIPLITGITSDWARGRRGWGSSGGLRPSEAGCDFQQNTGTFVDGLNQGFSDEVDEAAADMFLNWVYEELESIGLVSPKVGFENILWNKLPTATAPPSQRDASCVLATAAPTDWYDSSLSGQARSNYMNTLVMPTLAAMSGW